MTKLKELSKLNIGKLKANEMFDEFLKFKDNWVEVLTGEGHIELDTFEVCGYSKINMSVSDDIIVDLDMNDSNSLLKVFLIYKVFSKLFEDKNYRLIKNGKFTLLIEETELCYSLFKFGLMNLFSLIDFLTIYAKSFLNGLGKLKTVDCDLNLKADGENPLSLIRLGLISHTEMNHHNLSLETFTFSTHTKPTDVYAFEMVYFALFEKFTENCNIDPISEIKNPSPIYSLLYNKTKFAIIHRYNGAMEYNLYIEVDEKSNIFEEIVNEANETEEFWNSMMVD